MIREFTEGLDNGIRKFVREATEPIPARPGVLGFDELIEWVIRKISKLHGLGRITQSIEPAVRHVRVHENLARVLMNLLDNAMLASPKNDPVHIFATLEQGLVRIVVADRGCGIPPQVRERVFEPGFSTRSQSGGLGVGLAVAREMVQALGGTVELDANIGAGTRATVKVPVRS
jgi:signal transduction histidine kinase